MDMKKNDRYKTEKNRGGRERERAGGRRKLKKERKEGGQKT
jgi:hypothetical protein